MTDPRASKEVYSLRDNPAFEALHATRTAAQEAAFFLPYLRSGMQVLDVGCGPGTITVGLAEGVAPGAVIGIDLQLSQIEQARALAVERGVANVRFEVGDAYRLPFADHSFDAVFAHTVLMHLREPVRALAEMRRVLRPGGIAGVRDPDAGAGFLTPATPLLEQSRLLWIRVLQHNGAPFVGRDHRRLLLEAGFVRAEASAFAESAGSPRGDATPRRHHQEPVPGLGADGAGRGVGDPSDGGRDGGRDRCVGGASGRVLGLHLVRGGWLDGRLSAARGARRPSRRDEGPAANQPP
jgi:ubiquinone/menaquinone biosynthesis C-methylase UbiE